MELAAEIGLSQATAYRLIKVFRGLRRLGGVELGLEGAGQPVGGPAL